MLDAQLAGQVDQQNAEHLGLVRVAQQVHLLFDAVGSVQTQAQRALEFGPVERTIHRFVVEQFVEQLRMANQVAGRPARPAQHRQHAVQRLRIFGQQRQIRAAPAHRFEQVEQTRHRIAAPFARLQRTRGLQRALRDDVETLPAALGEPRVTRRLPDRAQAREQFARLGHTQFDSRACNASSALSSASALLQTHAAAPSSGAPQPSRPLTLSAKIWSNCCSTNSRCASSLRHQRRVVVATHDMRERRAFCRIDRHRVGLRIVAVLQTVLEFAQEAVRLRKLHAHRCIDQPVRGRVPQHGQRRTHPEAGVLAAANQLEHLRAELDLADAAAPSLMSSALSGRIDARRCASWRICKCSARIALDHAVVEIAAIDERRDDRVELLLQPLRPPRLRLRTPAGP